MQNRLRKFFTNEKIRLFLLGAILLAALIALLDHVLVFDHTAERTGDGFVWQGERYVYFGGVYRGGERLAKTADGFDILAVKGDKDRNFLVLADMLDNRLCVREGYQPPSDGALTGVQIKTGKILGGALTDAIDALRRGFTEERRVEIDSIHTITETRHMAELAFYYNDCPVGIRDGGWFIGKLDGAWVMARLVSFRDADDTRFYTYALDTVPDDVVPMLEKVIK